MLRILATALFALLTVTSAEAANAYISEYAVLTATATGGSAAQSAALPSLTDQKVDFSGGAASSAAFGTQTKYIRIHCDAACSVRVGGTATISNARIPLDGVEYFGVQPGATISVIANP
jgi:hypothetical protein